MIQCLICKKEFIKPLAHVWQKHHIFAREYKTMFSLDVIKGIVTQEHREILRNNVFKQKNIINNLKANGKKYRFKKKHKITYKRSNQSIKRLKKHIKTIKGGRLKSIKKIIIHCSLCGSKKMIYPRYYHKYNNYCGILCRNRGINNKFNK